MRNLFRSKHKITQEFGVNSAYYSKFGLSGHEGLDLIPTGTDWTVYALEDGVVVKDEDNARSGAYGVYVTIWHPSINKATQYCHMEFNLVENGMQVKKGQAIGKMGSTGNSTGAHVHLNLFNVDDSGVRLNRDNGFLGGIDPLPFLGESGGAMMQIDTKTFEELVSKSTKYDELLPEFERTKHLLSENERVNKEKDVIIEDLRQEAVRLRDEKAELQKANISLIQEKEIMAQAQEADAIHDRDAEVRNLELERQITDLNKQILELKEEKAAPIEPVIDHYEPILDEFWKNLFKGKKAQSWKERFWKWIS